MELFSFMNKKRMELRAFVSGELIPIEEVNDGVFSEKILGDGVAINPTSDELLSPTEGKVVVIMDDSYHAVGLQANDGTQILLHIGIDTVNMKGNGFHCYVKLGDKVKCGQKLIDFSRKSIREAGYKDTVILVITETGGTENIKFISNRNVTAGETVISKN